MEVKEGIGAMKEEEGILKQGKADLKNHPRDLEVKQIFFFGILN